jgi:hypothetical protein
MAVKHKAGRGRALTRDRNPKGFSLPATPRGAKDFDLDLRKLELRMVPAPNGTEYELQPMKIQRPLSSNTQQGMNLCMVYNATRTVNFKAPLSPQLEKMFKGKLKIFVMGRLYKVDGEADGFEVGKLLPDQGW